MTKHVSKKSILQLIKDDHKLLRESIVVLTSEETVLSEKKRQLERFIFNIKVHAKAEETSLYNSLIELQDIRPDILEGFEEHNMADHLMMELDAKNFQSDWSDEIDAKAKVLAEIIEHHVKDEETELFPKIKSYLTKTELENLGVIYLQTRKDLRRELESRFTLPSLKTASWVVQEGFKGTFERVSSFVSSKFSASR